MIKYSNSPLTDYVKISPNKNTPRNHSIDRISIHCYVAPASVEDMGAWFAKKSTQASCNYGIGNDGRVGMFVEEKDRSWCTSSRDNDNRAVTIECASDRAEPFAINAKVYNKLIKLCADICQRNGKTKVVWFADKAKTLAYTPKANEMVFTVHRWFANKSCPGEYIYSRLGKIAQEINNILNKEDKPSEEVKWYRIRKSWDDVKSQLGAYENLDFARNTCPAGYGVYDYTGKEVYRVPLSTEPSGIPASKEAFIDAVGTIAQKLMVETRILASVPTAQACLESGFGLGSDAKILTEANNILGMKADLINNTWTEYTVWDGKTVTKRTPEYYNGKLTYVDAKFRRYKDYENCITDYEMFLLHVRSNKGYKYRQIVGMTDPRTVITAISKGGYATDPAYIEKVMRIINDYNLTRFDNIKQTNEKDIYVVQRSLEDTKYCLGKFHVLSNAKKLADERWGYKVFNIETGQLVYEPKLAMWQKYCAKLIEMNQIVEDEIKAGKKWTYKNKKTSELSKTFALARKDNNRKTNCVRAVQWGLVDIGVDRSAIQWYGNKGIVWLNNHAKKDAEKFFSILDVTGNKTVKQCIKDGIIVPGDIIIYSNLSHTNVYLGNNQSFDSGHANCKESGEGAEFTKWICETPYQNYKVINILRLK